MAHADRDGLRRLQETLGAIGEFFDIHMEVSLLLPSRCSVALLQHKSDSRTILKCPMYQQKTSSA
jgi:hypothetical protein